MNPRSTHNTIPARRVLASGLLLAMSAFATAPALAGSLATGTREIVEGDNVENWQVTNDAHLIVNGGHTRHLRATAASKISLRNAFVSTNPIAAPLIQLEGSASLDAINSRINGEVVLLDNTSLRVGPGSSIHVMKDNHTPTRTRSIGIDLVSGHTGAPTAVLDSAAVWVEDAPAFGFALNSGIGARLQQGRLDISNGSLINASNVAALLWNNRGRGAPDTIRLGINASRLQSGRGAAIHVMPSTDNNYDINVSNGSILISGDGNLLLVRSDHGGDGSARTDVDFVVDDSRLIGNVTFDPTTVTNGTLDVILRNNAQIDGRFFNVTSTTIDTGSTWLMTGDSNVSHLTLGSTGTVALGNGSSFNTLSMDTFTGNGGTLAFNTHLGDDTSATDKLIIAGDTHGQANVRVLNAGGAGAKTDKGIELIRVGGASNAQFDLQGRAVGGQYEYFLFKDATSGGWYLRSELATTPDPCLADPTLPQCKPIVDPVDPIDPIEPPTPVLRPEAGAYLANQFAVDQLLRHGWRDRHGGSTAANDGVRGWARVDGKQSKLSAVEDQLDLRVDRSRLQLGADVGVFDNGRGRVGVMGSITQSSATSRSQLTGYSARGKVDGGALGVYGNWNSDALYVDASVQRGQFRNRVQGEGLAEERYDSDLWQSSLEAGHRIGIGAIGSTALSVQPELQLVYTDANIDVHTENNGTVVRSQGDSGLSGRMGLRLQGEGHSAAGASVSPYLAANWYRDGAGNGIAFDDEVLKAGIPRNRYELSAGARLEFRSGLSAWGGFGVMRGDHGYREATANVSVAYKW